MEKKRESGIRVPVTTLHLKSRLFFCRVRVHYSTDLTIIYMFTSLVRNESEIIGSYLELNLQMYFQFHLVSHH